MKKHSCSLGMQCLGLGARGLAGHPPRFAQLGTSSGSPLEASWLPGVPAPCPHSVR